jgi:peptide deformylase
MTTQKDGNKCCTERPAGFYPLFTADLKIVDKSTESVVAVEGCLSLPKQQVEVVRFESVSVRFLAYNNSQ